MTSRAILNATSLPASVVGPTPSSSPVGETDLFGQVLVPVSRSAPRENGTLVMTRGISGQRGFGSSASAALSESLASRLRAQLGTAGGTLFRQTWKRKRTSLGRLYWAHTASARPTFDNDCTSWPTATVHDADRGGQAKRAMGETRHGSNLQDFALLASWHSPNAGDAKGRTYQYDQHDKNKPRLSNEGYIRGKPGSSFHVGTLNAGQLNPAHSRWLMGYPVVWDACAPTATPSSRRSPQHS